jgi:hypothetical protein
MKNLTLTGIILTTALFTGAYAFSRQWPLALTVLGLGLLWGLGQWQQRRELDTPLFLAFIALAALGIYRGVSPFWPFLGTVAALATWDLSRFMDYLGQAEDIEAEATLQQSHLQHLQLTIILSLLLGSAALFFQMNLNFGSAVLLSLLMVVSLSLAVRFIRQGAE